MYERLGLRNDDFVDNLLYLVQIIDRKKGIRDAEHFYRKALAMFEGISNEGPIHGFVLASLAGAMRRRGQVEDARVGYEQAMALIEKQMAHLGGADETRAVFRARHISAYRDYADLLITQNRPEQAFRILERGRARVLLETIGIRHGDIRNGIDPSLLDREGRLHVQIDLKSEQRLRINKESDNSTTLEKELADLFVQYQDIEAQIGAASPAYAALTQPQPLTAKEVQIQLLDPNTLLLEYSLGEERSYVFAVTPNSLQAFELPKRSVLEKASRRVYRLLTTRNQTFKNETAVQKQARLALAEAEYPRAATELSKMILGPVASQLHSKRLLIVSDGALAYIPFSVLPEPANPAGAVLAAVLATAPPLVVNHEIVNLPSASVLAVLRQQEMGRKHAPKAVVVMADPVFDRHDSRVAFTRTTSAAKSSLQAPVSADLLMEAPSSAASLTRSAADVGHHP
jgi:hypothetical protein